MARATGNGRRKKDLMVCAHVLLRSLSLSWLTRCTSCFYVLCPSVLRIVHQVLFDSSRGLFVAWSNRELILDLDSLGMPVVMQALVFSSFCHGSSGSTPLESHAFVSNLSLDSLSR